MILSITNMFKPMDIIPMQGQMEESTMHVGFERNYHTLFPLPRNHFAILLARSKDGTQ